MEEKSFSETQRFVFLNCQEIWVLMSVYILPGRCQIDIANFFFFKKMALQMPIGQYMWSLLFWEELYLP